MNKTSKKIITFALVFVSLVLSFFGGYFVRYFAMDSEQRAIYDLIQKYKKYYYFDDGDLVKDISDAILDEYSEYFTKKEYIEILNGAKGNYSGIGISFEAKSLKIVGVIGNSPAEKAGVVKGGTLTEIAVDESFVKAQNFNNLSEILDSIPSEEEFKIKVRYGENTCEYTLSKQAYKRTYVHYYDNLGYYGFNDKSGTIAFEKLSSETIITNDTVGYIVYDSFNGTESGLKGSAKQIEHVLNKFKQDKKQNVILDLRDNGGGYMDILSEVSAHFINSNYGAKVKIAVAKDKYNTEEVFYS
ncbi:MAG: hypothetical protein J6Q38_05150, partial [Clostridia bacterium]|nr:hypothetical protein [Clostridia bacterium]